MVWKGAHISLSNLVELFIRLFSFVFTQDVSVFVFEPIDYLLGEYSFASEFKTGPFLLEV